MSSLISFVVPCYYSAKTIGSVVAEIVETMETQGKSKWTYEIILINDGSKDNTMVEINKLCKQNQCVKGLDLAKNFGQHNALMAGLNLCSGDYVVCLDDDGQTPANEVFVLMEGLNDQVDVVFARYKDKKHSWFRNLGSHLNEYMMRVLINKPKSLFLSSYFVAKRYVIEEIKQYKNPFPYISGLLLRTTDKIINVDVEHREREEGVSNYRLKSLIRLWVNGFTAFSVKPLRVASLTGIITALLGFIFLLFIVIKALFFSTAPEGWTSMIAILLFASGLMLTTLGLVGEYIGRIYISINSSPQYVVRNLVSGEDDDKRQE